ncbi:MAG: arylsulfotransferase family protein [Solirubrobacteraceae bacterium]
MRVSRRAALVVAVAILAAPALARSAQAPTQHFRSRPDLRPPVVSATSDPDGRSGDMLLTPVPSHLARVLPQAGPMILDRAGRLVWFRSLPEGKLASDLRVQRYGGRPVLTWWQGHPRSGGVDVITDGHYRTVAIVRAANGYRADTHEFQLTPRGTALIDAVVTRTGDLSSVGGPRPGQVVDDVIQELDVRTGRLLWDWDALQHVPLSASYQGSPRSGVPYDYFHLNSIQQLPGGNLLICARNTWAVYEISKRTGGVLWTLGGRDSSFNMGPGTKFEWQHDARLSGRTLSLFDDGALPQEEPESSAKLLRLDRTTRQVSLLTRITHSPALLAGTSGNLQTLPNHNRLVGWGSASAFSEYTPQGRQIFNASLPLGSYSYRVYRSPWRGRPHTPPALTVRRVDGQASLYASWNGATEVAAWRFEAGPRPNRLRQLGATAPRTGFETGVRRHTTALYYAVQALDQRGHVLGTSPRVQADPARGHTARAAPEAARTSLHVIPFPGTPDASPQTQIIFSSLTPSDLVSVSVRGSRSGDHAGHLVSLPSAAGAGFAPDRRFSPGESVRVRAALRSGADGTASGDPGATYLSFSFTVGRHPHGPAGAARDTHSGASGPPRQHFHSRPDLRPPVLDVTSDRRPGGGDLFLDSGQRGVLVLDGRGNVVWFHRPADDGATDVAVQRYRGRRVLTWWQGRLFSHAEDVILDQHYRTVATVRAGNGYVADPHEFQITPQGTALIDVYVFTTADLRSVGGPAPGAMLDCVIQEINIRTGQVLWEWHALGHIPFKASYVGRPKPDSWYDPYHINSIQQLPGGDLLISLRNTWAVYKIAKRTGKVRWSLGGKDPSFRMGPGTGFEWQHDALMHPDGTLSLFDDAGLPQEERQSSAKVLRLNGHTMTARLTARYTHSPPLLAGVAGSTQLLPDHDVLVNWGSQGVFSQYTPGGRQVLNVQFPLGMASYRALRSPWNGRPLDRPALAVVRRPSGVLRLYASWNGASDVAAWRFLGGSRPQHLRPLGTIAPRTGFETVVRRHATARYYEVQALDRRGRVLGTSAVDTLTSHG